MTTLTQADLKDFAKLSIPAELLDLAGVVRVTDSEARGTYGIKGGGDMAGIAFPYFDPETMSNGRRRTYVRIRRDHPELEDGKPKKKYVAPYGDRKRLYFPPTPELFGNPRISIVLVEAEKSVLSLTAWSKRTGINILPLGIGGCWGWRGQVGIKETATGERVAETGPIQDLNICREGRLTYVLLDANCATNPHVQTARRDLIRQLRKQGADVRILDLPAGEWNGPDDFVAVQGDEAMTQLFEGAAEGAKILNDVQGFLRRFVILSSAQSTAIALWIAHTYTFKSAAWTPYLNVRSAAPECGKSLLLEVLEFLVHEPWKVDGASPPVLFRKIEAIKPTLLFDELDTTFKGDKETAQAIRQVLNAGAKYNGTIARLTGKNWDIPKDFAVFCPKVLAGIGNLPPTVSSRALPITLGRKLTTEKVDYLDHDNLEIKANAAELRRRLTDWIEKRAASFKHSPDFPNILTDRQKDGARVLLAIADAAGGDWPSKARAVLCEIYGTRPGDDTSIGIQLLADVRLIYDGDQLERMTTRDLLEELSKVETSPWAEWNRGKPMTAVGLSRLLKPFEIYPKNIRTATAVQKGYERNQFEDAWGRYLPKPLPVSTPPPIPAATPLQANIHTGRAHFSETLQEGPVAGSRSEESPVSMSVVAAVADQKRGETHLEGEREDSEIQRRCSFRGVQTSMVRGEI